MNNLRLIIPFIPPSNNKSYVNNLIHGVARRVLSPEARTFERRFVEYINDNYILQVSDLKCCKEDIIHLFITTYFTKDKIFTLTKGAKYPYQKRDAIWGGKYVQDLLATVLGIDDLYHFRVVHEKAVSDDRDFMEIIVSVISKDEIKRGKLDVVGTNS